MPFGNRKSASATLGGYSITNGGNGANNVLSRVAGASVPLGSTLRGASGTLASISGTRGGISITSGGNAGTRRLEACVGLNGFTTSVCTTFGTKRGMMIGVGRVGALLTRLLSVAGGKLISGTSTFSILGTFAAIFCSSR